MPTPLLIVALQNSSESITPKRVKRPRLAEDGLPAEMFQDVKRACHRWLMAGKGNECEAYRMHQRMIERLMKSGTLVPVPKTASATGRPSGK